MHHHQYYILSSSISILLQVSYVHDGSESTQDAVIFEIELSSSRTPLDPEMRVRQRFRLQISIRPTNDVPSIGNQNRNKNSIHQVVLWSVLF